MIKRKTKIILVAVLGIVFLLLVGIIAFAGLGSGLGSPGAQKFWKECTVTIDEALIGKATKIESVSCVNVRTCGILPFGIFTAEGTVEMYDSQHRLQSKDFETDLFSGKDTVTLQGCTADSQVTIRLYDENRNLQDEQVRQI